MLATKRLVLCFVTLAFFGGSILGGLMQPWSVLRAQSGGRVFEIRTYTAPDGKLEALHSRFRDRTLPLFRKHGITPVAYFKPQDAPSSQNTMIEILSHQSREAAKRNWAAFQADQEWLKVAEESQVNGRIVGQIESVFADATDYSPLK
jgi:hypothetical protein